LLQATSNANDNLKKVFFPHIICDFDLSQAIKLCLVKSIALDERNEVNELEVKYK
jgi:type III restriction enzyme